MLNCTGSTAVTEENTIYIDFTDDLCKGSVSANTCSRVLTISTHINTILFLKDELNILVNKKDLLQGSPCHRLCRCYVET